jgi:hypothetical protein
MVILLFGFFGTGIAVDGYTSKELISSILSHLWFLLPLQINSHASI